MQKVLCIRSVEGRQVVLSEEFNAYLMDSNTPNIERKIYEIMRLNGYTEIDKAVSAEELASDVGRGSNHIREHLKIMGRIKQFVLQVDDLENPRLKRYYLNPQHVRNLSSKILASAVKEEFRYKEKNGK